MVIISESLISSYPFVVVTAVTIAKFQLKVDRNLI